MIPDNSIDLVLTDPPYLTTSEKWDKAEVFNEDVAIEIKRVCKPTACIYIWCGIGEHSQSLIRWFPILQKHLIFKDLITWKKRRGIGMRKGWLYTREEILWFVKDNSRFVWNSDFQYSEEPNLFTKGMSGYPIKSKFKRITNVWTDIPEELVRKQKTHYTPKPLKAIERIIQLHTKPSDIVLDPFSGSGTTALAALNLDRFFICGDIDPVSNENLNAFEDF